MDFKFSEEHLLIKQTVRDFAGKEIAPRAEDIDATDEFPADIFKRMGALGILGIPFAESYGGSGGDYLSLLIALEEIARVSGSVAIILDAHTSLCCEPLYLFGTCPPFFEGRRSAPLGSLNLRQGQTLVPPALAQSVKETSGSSTGRNSSSPMAPSLTCWS
jgi:hypothetical protein